MPCRAEAFSYAFEVMSAHRLSFTLLESAHSASWGARALSAGSVAGQVALMCGAVVWTAQRAAVAMPREADQRPTFLAPLFRPAAHASQQTLTYTAIGGPAVVDAPNGVSERHEARPDRALKVAETVASGDAHPPAEAIDDAATRAYSEIEVDSAATRDPDSEGPVYPPALMAKGVEGSVLATFVVDEFGRPDVATYIPLEATDVLFANAVRDALPRMKFLPAKRGATAVRQQVEQRFTFRVVRPAPIKPA